jgi:hypothetical protein
VGLDEVDVFRAATAGDDCEIGWFVQQDGGEKRGQVYVWPLPAISFCLIASICCLKSLLVDSFFLVPAITLLAEL